MKRAKNVQKGSNIPITHDVPIHTNINLGLNEQRPRHRFKSSNLATTTSGIGEDLISRSVIGQKPPIPASYWLKKTSSQSLSTAVGEKPNIDSFISQNLDGLKEIKNKNSLSNPANSVPPGLFSTNTCRLVKGALL